MTVLGIDIGSDTIKIVEMAKAAHHTFRLINYVIAPTPPDAVVDGDVRDPEMVGEALREVLKAQRFKANRVVTSVQGTKSTVVRIIELPRVSKNELAESMKFEVERHIPFAASQIIMDYAVIDRPGEAADSPNMEVLFAAVQEEVVELVVEALQRAKLKPLAIDVQPLALSRALVEAPSGGHPVGETVAIVNMGATVTDLSIVRDGLLHFPRTVPLAGRTITQRLSEGLGVSEQQAERLKREHGNVVPLPPGMVPVAPVVEEAVEAAAPADELGVGLDFEDVFQSDTGTESDVGFFGAGVATSGFQLDESEPGEPVERPEEEGGARTPFQLEETDNSEPGDGDFFNFNFDDKPGGTSFTLGPPEDDDPDAPVPDEPFSFTDDTETDEPPVFSFGDDEEAAEPDAPALALDATEEDDVPAPAEPAAAAGETVTDTETTETPAAEDEVAPFAFDATEPEATTEGTPTFQFDATDEETTAAEGPAPLAGAAAEEPAPPAPDAGLFDFNLGDTEDDSSLNVDVAPSPADQTGTTDVGSSFDLGDLATSESFDFDLAEVSEETQEGAGFNFTEPAAAPAAAGAPPAALPAAGGPAPALGDEALQVRQVIEPVMREIATEIGRSLDYYRSRYEGAVVDRLVIAGGTARMEGLAEFLEEELGLPVDRGDPLATLTVDNAKLTDEDLRRDAPVLAVAIGLALRELM